MLFQMQEKKVVQMIHKVSSISAQKQFLKQV